MVLLDSDRGYRDCSRRYRDILREKERCRTKTESMKSPPMAPASAFVTKREVVAPWKACGTLNNLAAV